MSVLVEAWNGAASEEVLTAPPDILQRMGLAEKLGMMRLRGLNAMVQRIKREVAIRSVTQAPGCDSEDRPVIAHESPSATARS
jgi:hypothetical protein